ncbi:Protein of unknown function (DUF3421) [Popillia japonica]|uniref:Uncharacterized protein n=1 Tax=Popillia japonica TaxID=7064 RepID=A0AAW1MFJ1_POPJA
MCFVYTLLILTAASLIGAIQHDVYWRDFIDGYIPEDAFMGDENLYIGQMPLNGILPGTIYPDRKLMISECCTGRKEATVGVKILCTRHPGNFKWRYVNTSALSKGHLDDLVRGGIENNNILYIGKVFHEGQWKIGKVYPTFHNLRGLRIWTSSGDVHVAHDFQILTYIDRPAFDVREGA